MIDEKKTFFKPRTEAQIQKLHTSNAYSQRNLIERIDSLNPNDDALILRTRITPGRFFKGKKGEKLAGKQASLKAYHHGDIISLNVPTTLKQCLEESRIPLKFRQEAFEKALAELKEEEINYIGYTTRVNFGDRQVRFFPFVWMPEGVKFFGYAETQTEKGIEINTKYQNAERAKREGVSVPVVVPSRTQKQDKYRYRLIHVPILRGIENLATVLNLKPAVEVGQDEEDYTEPRSRPAHDRWNFRYTWKDESEGSNRITFYPHDVAAYIGIIKKELENHNMTPLEMNPFALTSRHGAELYKKLCNNILIYDPSLSGGKGGLRHLHIDEKCILWARAIKVFRHDDIAYWDPGRDGKLKDYDWTLKK